MSLESSRVLLFFCFFFLFFFSLEGHLQNIFAAEKIYRVLIGYYATIILLLFSLSLFFWLFFFIDRSITTELRKDPNECRSLLGVRRWFLTLVVSFETLSKLQAYCFKFSDIGILIEKELIDNFFLQSIHIQEIRGVKKFID